MYEKTILKNGLRIITVPMKGTETATVFVVVGTGSRYETKEINGISHFLEHLFFKGTENRPTALAISEELEKVGAEFNAFTSKEYTGFYVKVPKFHLDIAMDVISDILLNSLFIKKEIEKEKGTIQEEIKMVKDDPPRYVADLFEILLYCDTPIGWEVIGMPETVKKISRRQILDYFKGHYVAKNAVVVLAGAIEKDKALKKIKKYFNGFDGKEKEDKLKFHGAQNKPEILIYPKTTNQTHISMGVRGYEIGHPDYYVLYLLSIILGGGMSSRLFISVRERRGLAYYIFSGAEFYTDTGYFTSQAGIDAKNVEKAISIILSEYKKIAAKGTNKEELKKVKDYVKSRIIMGLESSSAMASFFAEQEILEGKISTPKEKFAKIDAVTVKDIQRVAKDIFKNEKLNLALIGPFKKKNEKRLEKILRF